MIRAVRRPSPWFKPTTSVRKSRLLAVLPAAPPTPPTERPEPPTVDVIMALVRTYGALCQTYGASPTPASKRSAQTAEELVQHHVSLLDGYLIGTKYLLNDLQQALTTPPEEHP